MSAVIKTDVLESSLSEVREGFSSSCATTYRNEEEWTTEFFEPRLNIISERLDRLLIRKLELMQDYVNLSVQNERHMKDGYIHIAKSRYIMGPKAISHTNIPTETDELDNAMIKVENELVQRDDIDSPFEYFKTTSEGLKKDEVKIRRLFGVLTPQSLKKCQKSFQSSLNCIIELANISVELQCTEKEFSKLIEEKNQHLEFDYNSYCKKNIIDTNT